MQSISAAQDESNRQGIANSTRAASWNEGQSNRHSVGVEGTCHESMIYRGVDLQTWRESVADVSAARLWGVSSNLGDAHQHQWKAGLVVNSCPIMAQYVEPTFEGNFCAYGKSQPRQRATNRCKRMLNMHRSQIMTLRSRPDGGHINTIGRACTLTIEEELLTNKGVARYRQACTRRCHPFRN